MAASNSVMYPITGACASVTDLEDALRPLSCAYVENGYMESAASPARCREALEHSRLGSVLGTCRPQLSDAAGA